MKVYKSYSYYFGFTISQPHRLLGQEAQMTGDWGRAKTFQKIWDQRAENYKSQQLLVTT